MTPSPLTIPEIAGGCQNDRIGTDLVATEGGMRVWHLRLQPGDTLPPHRHDRPYFWTVLTDGQAVSRYGDGTVAELVYKAGETRHYPDLTPDNSFVHDLTNTGTEELVFVTVEFNR